MAMKSPFESSAKRKHSDAVDSSANSGDRDGTIG
jgi:hypothetical protein